MNHYLGVAEIIIIHMHGTTVLERLSIGTFSHVPRVSYRIIQWGWEK